MRASSFFSAVLLFGCGGGPSPGTDAAVAIDSAVIDSAASPADAGGSDADMDGGAGGDTWTTYASDFFAMYCVRCHSGPPSGRDFRTILDVRRDAARIRCGVAPLGETQAGCGATPAPALFPIGTGPFPSDADRRRIIAWIDAGLLE